MSMGLHLTTVEETIGRKIGCLTILEIQPARLKKEWIFTCLCDCGNILAKVGTQIRGLNQDGLTKCTRKCPLNVRRGPRDHSGRTPGETSLKSQYSMTKWWSAKRKKAFELSFQEYKTLVLDRCYYCNRLPTSTRLNSWGDPLSRNGIDRVDNDLGYTLSNCVSCCLTCNRAKHKDTKEVFLKWIQTIDLEGFETTKPPIIKIIENEIKPELALGYLISNYKYHAKVRNYVWDLTKEKCQELFKSSCFYCNSPPMRLYKHPKCGYQAYFTGIDRHDNTKDYTVANSVACCKYCNYAKSDKSAGDLRLWLQDLLAYQKDYFRKSLE